MELQWSRAAVAGILEGELGFTEQQPLRRIFIWSEFKERDKEANERLMKRIDFCSTLG